jgi:hypothetical protein
MNAGHCCKIATRDRDNSAHGGGEIAGWIVPTATLAVAS